ncbi:MAG: carbonic anhydrase [Bacteroidetes bacterium]|nr:carbonic anhydrase [Bacteroidota bacterium]
MRTLKFKILLLAFAFIAAAAFPQDYVTQTKETQKKMTPKEALQNLKDGNARFIDGKMTHRNFKEQMEKTAKGQYPFAVILSCIDSRSPSEIVFDQGIGDIFNARVAGNIADSDIIGSLEFACKVAGSKLILVMGHSNCGAIKGACDDVKLGNLTGLLSKITPAIESVSESGERNSKNHDYVEKVAKQNVIMTMEKIKKDSSILKEMIDNGEIMMVGAMYDLETGVVTFYE